MVGMLWCSAYQTRRKPLRSAARASSTEAAKLSWADWPRRIGARSSRERATDTRSTVALPSGVIGSAELAVERRGVQIPVRAVDRDPDGDPAGRHAAQRDVDALGERPVGAGVVGPGGRS